MGKLLPSFAFYRDGMHGGHVHAGVTTVPAFFGAEREPVQLPHCGADVGPSWELGGLQSTSPGPLLLRVNEGFCDSGQVPVLFVVLLGPPLSPSRACRLYPLVSK